ncbi:TPA: hypothetical protein POA17_002584 [Escherichia coli]|nr:hypothetical protein [Escherichia coli]EFN6670350.1 hypothetical protein [Escherichia coli O8:H10]MEC9837869.1 hypothetical protein [Escherichia marmotae]EAC1422923.1 hypothetical protein [Escherichia coli]EAC1990680.1 hypothetical protein [Escherichia coli]EED0306362.1 hypothetical protein [Escherichia coli]
MIKNFIFDSLIILAVPFMIKTSLKTNLIFFFFCVFVPRMAS